MAKHHTQGQPLFLDGENWYRALDRLKPPALVRAVLILVAHHVGTLLSVSLTPDIAEVYLSDPETWPVNDCEGCGYPMPGPARLLDDDTYEHLGGVDLRPCPVCGLDNHSE
jgi:hypothetical protein